jgi:hypothetical protein
MKVINSQLGYRNKHSQKRVLVSDVPEARSLFGEPICTVMEQNDVSKYSLNAPEQLDCSHRTALKRIHPDFGTWLEADFSHMTGNGIYQIMCGNTLGPNFAIREDVYCRILPECIRYFQVQSCGREVIGWHDACHLDDGYIVEEDRYVDAASGWHDAGDFRKWPTSIALNAIALLLGHRQWKGREGKLGLPPDIFLTEALQGVHYFLNIQDPETGALLHAIGSGKESWHDNLDCRYTDNIKESGDERRIWPGWAWPTAKFTALFSLYANELKDTDVELAERCHTAARNALRRDKTEDGYTALHLQWRTWGYLELYRYTGSEDDMNSALATLAQLLDLQVSDYIGGQSQTRGFFRSEAGKDDYHRQHIGASYVIYIIAEFIKTFPDHPHVNKWRDAITMWVDDYALVFAARNPFGLLPYGLYAAPQTEHHPHHHYRQIGDQLYFRYFMAAPKFGTNARCSLDAVALGAAAQALNRPELVSHAYRLLEWTLGCNPFQVSTMNGVGVRQPCALSFQMGNIPGGVTMGVFGDEDDQPWYPEPWACTDEYYGFQTSHFMWGLLTLQDETIA